MFDYIIVGAGLAGGVLARKLAEETEKNVLIVERRDHIAGNLYDYDDAVGVKVQKYGPHTFHTNSEDAYSFISRFCEPISYTTKCEAVVNGISTPSPFNFKTIDQFYSANEADSLKSKLLSYYDNRKSVTVVEMLESEDSDIKNFAEFLFEHDYRPYTAKQWNLTPEEIDPSVLKRVPIALSYADTYFYDKYEFMPKNGFTAFYEELINHPRIEVRMGVDALEHIIIDDNKHVVLYDGEPVDIIYTGAIDELFAYKFGALPYRALYFEFKNVNTKSFQNAAIVAYPAEPGYTRITEYTKMPVQNVGNVTSVVYEFPVAYDKQTEKGKEPYYPVLTEKSKKTYESYAKYASSFKNLVLCGRLADFKYYNMDQVVVRSLQVYEKIKEKL
ncbi:MAG: UDP-galactopyranose mutase [Clostridiaceae bacterium]|nr:UDP-galactopyranose mutase [Clostridiaceae bacterium]